MDKNNSTKVVALVALMISVLGISVGFAAFSNTLTISSSANVKPDKSKFDVNFSSTTGTETAGTVVATATPSTITGDDATIDNSTDAPTIKGLKANFTEPGQKVVYSFFAHNAGEYIAYLNSVTFANVDGETASKVCTAELGTSQALVNTACNDISVTLSVGGNSFEGSVADISNHSLALDAYEEVEVTIEYKTNANNINIADGDFSVSFGDISLVYGTVD